MRLFAAIADRGSISAAARMLGVQKSTVSRDLVQLESRLGARLVNRSTRRMSLTAAGEVLATYARRVVEEMDHASDAIEAMSDEPRGILRVTAPYAILRFVIAPNLCAFTERYPEVRLALDPTISIRDMVEEGIDVAIRIGELPPSTLIAKRLTSVPLVLVASSRYIEAHSRPERPEDLSSHALIDLSPTMNANIWPLRAADGSQRDLPISPLLSVGDPGTVLDFVLQDIGIGLMPMIYAAPLIADGRLVHVLPAFDCGEKPVNAVYTSRHHVPPKTRAFIAFMGACLAGGADGWRGGIAP